MDLDGVLIIILFLNILCLLGIFVAAAQKMKKMFKDLLVKVDGCGEMKVYEAKIEMVFDVVVTKDTDGQPGRAQILDSVSKALKHIREDKVRVLGVVPVLLIKHLPEDWGMTVPYKERIKILTELKKETK